VRPPMINDQDAFPAAVTIFLRKHSWPIRRKHLFYEPINNGHFSGLFLHKHVFSDNDDEMSDEIEGPTNTALASPAVNFNLSMNYKLK